MSGFLKYKTRRMVEEEHELIVPSRWGMFSTKGNKRLYDIAQEAVDNIMVLDPRTHVRVNKILVNYLTKWCRMWYTKSYRESGDTAVREYVGDFHDKLYSAALGNQCDYSRWEQHYEMAQERARPKRARPKGKR